MDRYLLQKSSTPDKWVCTDTVNQLVCIFENKKFNESQEFTLLEETGKDYKFRAKICREMAEWLSDNHLEKASSYEIPE